MARYSVEPSRPTRSSARISNSSHPHASSKTSAGAPNARAPTSGGRERPIIRSRQSPDHSLRLNQATVADRKGANADSSSMSVGSTGMPTAASKNIGIAQNGVHREQRNSENQVDRVPKRVKDISQLFPVPRGSGSPSISTSHDEKRFAEPTTGGYRHEFVTLVPFGYSDEIKEDRNEFPPQSLKKEVFSTSFDVQSSTTRRTTLETELFHETPAPGATGTRDVVQSQGNTYMPPSNHQATTTRLLSSPIVSTCPHLPLPRVVAAYNRSTQNLQPTGAATTVAISRVSTLTEDQMKRGFRPTAPIVLHQLNTIADYISHKSELLTAGWQPPAHDPSFPTTEAQARFYVNRLLAALTDVQVARDSTGPNASFWTRWLLKMSKGGYHCTDNDMASICWELVDIAMTLQLYGPDALNIYDPDLIKEIQEASGTRFNERIIYMCKVMTCSKARCISLMQGELEIFVANIIKIKKARETNVRNNPNRSKMKAELNWLRDVVQTGARKDRVKPNHTVSAADTLTEEDTSNEGGIGKSGKLAGEQQKPRVKAVLKNNHTPASTDDGASLTLSSAATGTDNERILADTNNSVDESQSQFGNFFPFQIEAERYARGDTTGPQSLPNDDKFVETYPIAAQWVGARSESMSLHQLELNRTFARPAAFDSPNSAPVNEAVDGVDFSAVNHVPTHDVSQASAEEDGGTDRNEVGQSFQSPPRQQIAVSSEFEQFLEPADLVNDFTMFMNNSWHAEIDGEKGGSFEGSIKRKRSEDDEVIDEQDYSTQDVKRICLSQRKQT
ncbi:hypothetical protein C7974DRAFT_449153 [Boeremia exigua]|uniref:uncharacterized protein n=1 Tax=Boeremia exigua TaxID=749465 RepID=UPI001E8E6A09|nr:uncharacterized protein C7974DRAFT_449153 [Boeremia exigua]KAH6639188.1 hypothetical protein C7974DRAFT_449153 [Boeremia exigua]